MPAEEPALLVLLGAGLLAAGFGARRLQGKGLLVRLEMRLLGPRRIAVREDAATFGRWTDARARMSSTAPDTSASVDAAPRAVMPVDSQP
jgi:hypothetical protein